MSQEIRLTNGDDYFEFTEDMEWSNVFGEAGNDTLVFVGSGGTALGGPGNDTLESRLVEPWWWYEVAYWDSPNPVRIDLSIGQAEDGWGGIDRLINITKISFGGNDGDMALGSARDEQFNLGDFYRPGRLYIDGRDGVDTVRVWRYALDDFQVQVSVDARSVVLSKNGYVATLDNIEALAFEDRGQDRKTYRVSDLIDTGELGEQTLVNPGATGWSSVKGQPTSLSYSFMALAPSYGGNEGGAGFSTPSAPYQEAVRSILGELSLQTGLQFTEVPDTPASYGQLRFGVSQQAQTKGYAFVPGQANADLAGDVWLDTETTELLQPGEEGWAVLLHEIGHALGLEHALSQPSANSERPMLLSKWNHHGYTVMSDTKSPSGLWPQWFGPLDIQALQSLYGTTATAHSTPRLVTLGDSMGEALVPLVLQGSPGHVLDASSSTTGVLLDLRPGQASSVGLNSNGLALGNLTLGFDTWLHWAIGSDQDDVILGNQLDNILWAGLGNDQLEGGEGSDTVVIPGSIASYSVTAAMQSNTFYIDAIDGASGSKQLRGIEWIQFDDALLSLPGLLQTPSGPLAKPTASPGLLALDILSFSASPGLAPVSTAPEPDTPNVSQGARAQAIGMVVAAFGAPSLPTLLDIATGLYSNGLAHSAVATAIVEGQFIETQIGSTENGPWVQHVYSNLAGQAPDAQTLAGLETLLSTNQASRAGLLEVAAGLTPLIEQQANLVGMSMLEAS